MFLLSRVEESMFLSVKAMIKGFKVALSAGGMHFMWQTLG